MFRSVNHYRNKKTKKQSVLQLLRNNLSKLSPIFMLLAVVGFFIAIALFYGLEAVNMRLERIDLYLPTIILWIITNIIIKLSPQQKSWSRRLIVIILIGLSLRYLYWRSLSTLNLSNFTNGLFSIILLAIELLFTSGTILQLYLMLNIKSRHYQADQVSRDVINQ